MRRKVTRALVRLIGPVLLAIVILRIDDPAAVLAAIRSARVLPLAAALALNLVNIYLKVIRWDALLRARSIRYPIRRALGAFLTSLYLGMLTPGRVGDVLRVRYLRHDLGVPHAEGLASVVMDRLCDLYVLSAFVAVGVAHYSAVIAGKLWWITWGGIAVTVLAPLLVLVPGLAERAVRAVFPARGHNPALFLEALRAQVGRPLAITVPLTVVTFLVTYVQGSLIAASLGLSISFFDVTCLLSIASLLGLLPISVSGVGVRELFFALVFPLLGYGPAAGVSFGLVIFAVIHLAIVALGFVSWQIAPPPGGTDPRRAVP